MAMKTIHPFNGDVLAMQAAQKKQRKTALGIMFIIFAAISLMLAFVFISDADVYEDVMENGAPDFNYLTDEEFAELPYVSGNVELVLDYFAEEYETTNGVRTSDKSDKLFYLVTVSPTDAEGYYHHQYLITLEAEPSHFEVLDTICDETWAEEVPYEYTLFDIGTSKVTKMDSEIAGYLDEFITENDLPAWLVAQQLFGDISVAEAEARILPYVIEIGSEPMNPKTAIAFFVASIVLLLLGVLLLVKAKKSVQTTDTSAYAGAGEAPSAPTCPQCHAQLSETDTDFCPFCGRDLKA